MCKLKHQLCFEQELLPFWRGNSKAIRVAFWQIYAVIQEFYATAGCSGRTKYQLCTILSLLITYTLRRILFLVELFEERTLIIKTTPKIQTQPQIWCHDNWLMRRFQIIATNESPISARLWMMFSDKDGRPEQALVAL